MSSHRVRNTGKISTAVTRSLKEASKVILLTGTPMVNSPLDMSALVNIVKGNKIMPVENEQFEDHFMILKSMIPPPLKDRCSDYSAITCSDNGKVVWYNRCTYHYYRYMMKQPKNIREKEGFVRVPEYESAQEQRIADKRQKLDCSTTTKFKSICQICEMYGFIFYARFNSNYPQVENGLLKLI